MGNTTLFNTYLMPQTVQWIDQLAVTPSGQYVGAINDLVRDLISNNIWNNLDRFWIFATEQKQHAQISLVNPKNGNSWPILTEVNSPTWTALKGYNGNGSNSYLNTNFNPSTNGVNTSQNNASMGIYSFLNNVDASKATMGAVSNNTTVPGTFMNIQNNTGGTFNTSLNSQSFSAIFTPTSVLGMFSTTRISSSQLQGYYRGVLKNTVASNSQAPLNLNIYLLTFNDNGSPNQFSQHGLSCFYYGGNSIDQLKIYNIFQKFAAVIGFAV
jgi:hypothetical protein